MLFLFCVRLGLNRATHPVASTGSPALVSLVVLDETTTTEKDQAVPTTDRTRLVVFEGPLLRRSQNNSFCHGLMLPQFVSE